MNLILHILQLSTRVSEYSSFHVSQGYETMNWSTRTFVHVSGLTKKMGHETKLEHGL